MTILPPDHHLVPTGPTHILLLPIDPDATEHPDQLTELADRVRSRLPPWLTAALVPGMRGDAVMVPMNQP